MQVPWSYVVEQCDSPGFLQWLTFGKLLDLLLMELPTVLPEPQECVLSHPW